MNVSDKKKVEELLAGMSGEMDGLIAKVRETRDPDTLAVYRKWGRKRIPFRFRSWILAYFLRDYLERSGGKRRSLGEGITLFVGIGRNRKVFPRDLLHLFVNTGKVPRASLGEIKIFESYSFVSVEKEVSQTALGNLDGINYRGRKLMVNLAHAKEGNEA